MKHANYDAQGVILGFYDDEIHSDVPSPSIPLTEMQWRDCVENPGLRRVDQTTKTIVNHTQPGPSLSNIKSFANKSVDYKAGKVRERFISLSSGIEHEYVLAERQARQYALDGYPASVPVCVQALADRDGITSQAAADLIVAKADAFSQALETIRMKRLLGKGAIKTAGDAVAVESACDAAIADLDSVTP